MNQEHSTTAEVVDPVCGMSIMPEDATGTAEYQGMTYYFCHPSCEEKFRANPEDFVGDRRLVQPMSAAPGYAALISAKRAPSSSVPGAAKKRTSDGEIAPSLSVVTQPLCGCQRRCSTFIGGFSQRGRR